MVKNPSANAGDVRMGWISGVGKIPWRRKWQPPPVFLPGKSYGQRSLAGYGLWVHKEPDTMYEHSPIHTNLGLPVPLLTSIPRKEPGRTGIFIFGYDDIINLRNLKFLLKKPVVFLTRVTLWRMKKKVLMNIYMCLYSAFHFFLKNFFLRVVSTLLFNNTKECIFTFGTHTHN